MILHLKRYKFWQKKLTSSRIITSADQRTNEICYRKLSIAAKEFVDNHIKSIPAYESHYSRQKSTKKYLSSDFNISILYDLYCQECDEKLVKPVCANIYRKIFKEHNLGFRKPVVDTCNECDEFRMKIKMANEVEKKNLSNQLSEHHDKAQKVYETKRADVQQAKSDSTVETVSFDLQKCLPTPNLTCGKAYYCRQLYTLNLTMFETDNCSNKACCYMWNESIARRGSQEIASCLYKYLKATPSSVLQLNFYSDRCLGQNHNFIVCSLFSLFIEECLQNGQNIIITHKFMVTGHSLMEVDTIHSAIEKQRKTQNVDIETPQHWATFIRSIKRRIPIQVVEMNQTDFLAFKQLNERYRRPQFNETGEIIRFQKIMVFEYRTSAPHQIFFNYNVTDEVYQNFSAMKIL